MKQLLLAWLLLISLGSLGQTSNPTPTRFLNGIGFSQQTSPTIAQPGWTNYNPTTGKFQGRDATGYKDWATEVWVLAQLSGIPSPNLQSVTTTGNLTDRGIQITGQEGFTLTNSLALAYDASAGSTIANINGGLKTFIALANDYTSIGIAGGPTLTLNVETSINPGAGVNSRFRANDGINANDVVTIGQLPGLIPSGTLQSITNTGNSATNALQITGSNNLDPNKDGSFINYNSGNTYFGNFLSGAPTGYLQLGSGLSLLTSGSNTLQIRNSEDAILAGSEFSTRVSGSNAINNNDFITKGQLSSLVLPSTLQLTTNTGNTTSNALIVNGADNLINGINKGLMILGDSTANTGGITVFSTTTGQKSITLEPTRIVLTSQNSFNLGSTLILYDASNGNKALFNTPVAGLDAVNSDEFITKGQLSSLVPVSTLQLATDGGNTSSNSIAITGSTLFNPNINQNFIGYNAAYAQYSNIRGGGEWSSLLLGNNRVILKGTTTNFLDMTTTQATFATKVGGQDATVSSDFATLGQVNSLISSSGGSYAPTTGGTGYIQNQNSIVQASSNFWISGTGRIGNNFGIKTAPSYALDIAEGNTFTMLTGADNNAQTRTNSTLKISRWGIPHYTNAEEPMTMLIGESNSTGNVIRYGGGTGLGNAATLHSWFTSSNNTTVTGTEVMTLTSQGFLGLGITNPQGKLDIRDDTNNDPFLFYKFSNTPALAGGFFASRAGGTISAPTAVNLGDRLFSMIARGYNGSAYNGYSVGVFGYAGENYTSTTNNGSYVSIETTANGTGARTEKFRVSGDGTIGILTSPAAPAGTYNILARSTQSGTIGNVVIPPTTGTGSVTLNGSPTFTAGAAITGAAATQRALTFVTAGSSRWRLLTNSTGEGGSNGGSDFAIQRYNDAGVYISDVLFAERSTGVVTIPTLLANNIASASNAVTQILGDASTRIATTQFVSTASTSGNAATSTLAANSTQWNGQIYDPISSSVDLTPATGRIMAADGAGNWKKYNSSQIAAFLQLQIGNWNQAYSWGNHATAGYAPTSSPTFTGTPSAPTASAGTNTTQIATTAFVTAAVGAGGGTNYWANDGSGRLSPANGGTVIEFSTSSDPIKVTTTSTTGYAVQGIATATGGVGGYFTAANGIGLAVTSANTSTTAGSLRVFNSGGGALASFRTNSADKAIINNDGSYETVVADVGVIIKSANGTRWRVTVTNGGVLTTTAL